MKNILVPTDFSACATNAMELGFAFANFFKAKLHFLSVFHIPENWEKVTEEEKNKFLEQQQEIENGKVLLQEWEKRAKKEGIHLVTKILDGQLLEQLKKYAAETQADFVVMGSQGASGKQEYFIGSNTQRAIRKLNLPIFVIKHPLKEYAFRNVVFASGFDANEKETFLKFLDFIKWFTPKKIHLLAINTSGWYSQPSLLMKEAMNDFKILCKGYDCKTHFYRGNSVDSGIRNFTQEIEADLIVVSNHHRSPLKRIFQGSNIEALVNHSRIPVLSMDFKEEVVES